MKFNINQFISYFFALITSALLFGFFLRDYVAKVLSRFFVADISTGRIAIYYGCADTVTGLCFTTVDETIKYIKDHNELQHWDKDEGRF